MILKLKNKFLIILTAVIFGIIMLINHNNTTFAESDGKDDGLLLIQTLSKANVDIERMVLKYSGLVKTYKDSIHIRSFKKQLERAFSIDLIQISKSDNKDLIKYQGKKVVSSLPNTTIQVALANVQKENGAYDVYLIVSLVNNSDQEADFTKSFTYLKNSLEKSSIQPKIKINIQGSLNRKLSHSSQEKIIKAMFEDLEAPVTEGLNEREVISLTGFSNKLSYSINSHKNPVNVQIASRFDPLKNKTNFTIGTPLITIVY